MTVTMTSLLSSEPKLGEPSETALFSFASVWIFASWNCRRLHMSNTPISLAIRTMSTTSTLTRTYCCHPRPSTLVITRKANWMFLFYGDEFCYRLVQDLTTRTTRECGIDGRSRDNNWNVCWTFRSGLLRNTRLGISFKIRCMVRRLIGVLQL